MTLAFAGTKRFEIVGALGRGGMGEVFEAFDREQGVRCALKLLPSATPRALQRFKHEFRVLQGLNHPNLLALGELLHDGEHWFFSMELVDGVDFLAWVRGDAEPAAAPVSATVTAQDSASLGAVARPAADARSSFDEARLRDALSQLAEGLRFLHEAGKVHHDVKPSNVLVTPAGRVVILDFGLVRSRGELEPLGPSSAAGTPGYIAPEQLLDGEVGAPADLYAMGVVLFRALTGTFPSSDASVMSSLLPGSIAAPRPSALVSGVPPALDELCAALLAPDPAARPSARDVLAWLGTVEPAELHEPSVPFVGRRVELAEVLDAYQESRRRPIAVVLEGPSGIGKTALFAELTARLRARPERPLVLTGRCYEHEGIPYKAIDGVMDELGDVLARDGEPLALPANASLLSVLFPVLRRVPAFARGEAPDGDAFEMRRGAERVGRALFAALAARRPVVVAIDDFQWSDSDSATFLSALARAPDAPPFLLLVSSRARPVLPLAEDDVRRVSLAPLEPDDARELATRLLRAADGAPLAGAIAAEAGGNPFFLCELAWRAGDRPGGARLEDVLWERISACRGPSRGVLELVAVAAAPIAQSLVAEAAGLDAGAFARAAQDLRTGRLVRTAGIRPDDAVEAYHDRVRETVVARLAAEARAERHLRLAAVLERRRPDDFDALVTHFEGGGDGERAGAYAVRAGDQAARALAFERAAAFYRRALASLPAAQAQRERLRVKLADALANAGLGRDAAAEYQRAAEHSEPSLALELQRRAAEHLLRSGRLDEGLRLLGAILERVRVRVPKTPARAFAALLLHRARVRLRGLAFTERPAAALDEADLLRVDTLWAASARLGAIDTIRAADFQARSLLLCLDLGEPFRVARVLLSEAIFVSMGGPRRAERVGAILERARPVVRRVAHPYTTALLVFAEGIAAYQAGRYRDGLAGVSRAAELFETTCTGASHDVAVSRRFALDCLVNLGELAEVSRQVPALLDDAERRGDLYLAAELRTGLPNIVWLCSDRPDDARRANDRGIEPWSRGGFYLQHYYHALASVHIALYTGDGAGAWRTVGEVWRRLRTSLLLEVQAVRIEALYLRARAGLADGGRAGLAAAGQMAARIAREAVPSAAGLAAAARAGLAARRGDRQAALALLRTAERELAAAGVGLGAAACRLHLGRLAPSEGEHAEADAWMRARGIARPDRFAALLVPGLA